VQDRYLVCKSCNGYYKIQKGEDYQDYELCFCGGELIPVNDINSYYQDYDNSLPPSATSKKSLILISASILIGFMIFLNVFYSPVSLLNTNEVSDKFILGSDNRGFVTKEIYGNSINTRAIAVVTGIHPREKLSKRVITDVVKNYGSSSNLGIVHYDITVTNNPENYITGRNNGEGLAADYVLSDIKKSSYDVVIICHDHKPGYGSGFYIATPQMDESSVKLAQFLNQTLGNFNYYRSDNIREHSTSALRFSRPLASAGYKTLVYEIPGLESYSKAYDMTYKCLDKCALYLT